MYDPDPELAAFLARLPRTETHLHIEGALPWSLLHRLDPARFAAPPEFHAPDYHYASFTQFESVLLEMAGMWYQSPERYHAAARVIFAELVERENVRYLETSCASGVIEHFRLDGQAVVEAIRAAAPAGIEVRVYLGIHHDGYTERSAAFIEDSLGWEGLAGYDLHGTETFPLEPWTADFWRRARAAGKRTKAHAGEFRGADFVRQVIDELGVTRVQHGVRAIEDPALVARLAANGITLDVCPISNVKLGVVPSMREHPIRRLHDAGVRCTLSTDDPLVFGNRLSQEYAALHRHLGFSFAELAQLARNGFLVADMDEAARAACLREIEQAL
jgi:adenosine deaminase